MRPRREFPNNSMANSTSQLFCLSHLKTVQMQYGYIKGEDTWSNFLSNVAELLLLRNFPIENGKKNSI